MGWPPSAPRERLVLTDIMMPGLDGFGLLRELRADSNLAAVPIILLSARAGEEARIEGMQAGADDYLIKPFNARELLARVESQLKMTRFRQEMAAAAKLRTAQFETLLNRAILGVYLVDAARISDARGQSGGIAVILRYFEGRHRPALTLTRSFTKSARNITGPVDVLIDYIQAEARLEAKGRRTHC